MPAPRNVLKISDHSRASAGMTYVYPVISRRAGGVSIGINLNPNNACNWRCIYCQVPDLKRGGPPTIDLAQLRRELDALLDDILHGRFMESRVPENARHLMDIAFSGNGEPTSAKEFPAAVGLVADVMANHGLKGNLPLRLITNGSLMDRVYVKEGVACLGDCGGEVWFKVDAATEAAISRTNSVRIKPDTVLRRLRSCAVLCPTWIQTCMFMLDGKPPSEDELEAYVGFLGSVSDVVAGVHLYGLARDSQQPEAPRLTPVSAKWMEALGNRLRQQGLTVKVSP